MPWRPTWEREQRCRVVVMAPPPPFLSLSCELVGRLVVNELMDSWAVEPRVQFCPDVRN